MTSTLWLSCHVAYACRHSGVCCRAGWPLPVEDGVVAGIDRAVTEGRLATTDGGRVWMLDRVDAPEGVAGTLRQTAGACVFHRQRIGHAPGGNGAAVHDVRAESVGGGHGCAVHETLGHDALPSTCQHFPRVCLVDDRGVRVSLSHVCPTAAAMLVDDDRPVSIVPGPAPVPGRAVPEGLDARGQLPPRLTDRVLADWEGFTAWEAHVVEVLAGAGTGDVTPEGVLARLRDDALGLSRWRPSSGPLADAVARLSRRPADVETSSARGDGDADARRRQAQHALVRATCREPWTWPAPAADIAAADLRWVAPAWAAEARVVRRYLAARAFGAWVTYRVEAARGLVHWLTLVLDVLRIECAVQCGRLSRPLDRDTLTGAIRQTDLLLLHYADDVALADALAGGRGSGPGR